MAVETSEEFLDVLAMSHLLAADQLAAARALAKYEADPRRLAKRLVQSRYLTQWQAEQLLAGRNKLFLGRYKLLELLGVGGMGAVYKAVQPAIGRTVALKVMSRAVLKRPDAVTRFMREIRSAAALNHPNIVAAYDADRVGETYFLVMEYVPGTDLKKWIREYGMLPIDWSCECARQVALGLAHAFERGMVHRDIKPTNLMVFSDNASGRPRVKILDMGLARFASENPAAGELTQTGQIMGSPNYISPEQAQRARDADIRADIFSLGCTLFEMLTGRLPYAGETVMEKLLARVTHDAPRVRTLRADVPAALDAIVSRMMARDPALRFQTPAEVAAALAPFAAGIAVAAGEGSSLVLPAAHPAGDMIQADADPSLNEFVASLADSAAVEGMSSARPSMTERAVRRWITLSAVAVAIAVCGGLMFWFLPGEGPVRKPPQRPDSIADHHTAAGTPSQRTRPPPVPDNAERRALLWVLKAEGTVVISMGGEERTIEPWPDFTRQLYNGDLPTEGFHVTSISLRGSSQVDDAGLEQLARLTKLREIDLRRTNVTAAGVAALRTALPGCKIQH